MHIISLQGRPCLLAVESATRYAFTLFDLSAADWGALQGTFFRGLEESLRAAGMPQARGYLADTKAPLLTKTHGRRAVAFLNRAWEDVAALDYTIDQSRQSQPLLDAAVNALPRRCAGYLGLAPSDQRLRRLLDSSGLQ